MKTLPLFKEGQNFGDVQNSLLYFEGFEKTTHEKIIIEFIAFQAWYYDHAKKRMIESGNHYDALGISIWKYEPIDERGFKECHGVEISTVGLEMLHAPFNKNIKYTYGNILKIVYNLTGKKYEKIELIDHLTQFVESIQK